MYALMYFILYAHIHKRINNLYKIFFFSKNEENTETIYRIIFNMMSSVVSSQSNINIIYRVIYTQKTFWNNNKLTYLLLCCMHTKVFIGRDSMMRKILLITQLKIQFDIMRKTNFETRKVSFFYFRNDKKIIHEK